MNHSPKGKAKESRTSEPSKQRSTRRIAPLLVILLMAAIALPVTRYILFKKPPPPPSSASVAVQMKYYSDRITNNPADVESYVALGKLDERAGFFTDALRRFYSARALGAKESEFLLPLGRSLVFLGHFDEARAECEKAVRQMPDSIKAAGVLADVYDAEGRGSEAVAVMANYLDHHPQVESDGSAAGLEKLEQLLYYFMSDGDNDRSLKVSEDLIRLSPSQPQGYAVAGQIYVAKKQPQLAVSRLETAVKLAPNEASIRYTYGVALAAAGKDSDALLQWQKAVMLDPNMINAYYRLAEAYDRRKDYNHCSIALQKIALTDLSNAGAAAAAAFTYEKAGKPIPAAYWRSVEAAAKKDYQGQLKFGRIAAADPEWHKRAMGAIAAAYRGLNMMKEYIDAMQQVTSAHTAEDDVTMAGAYGAADKLDDQNRMLNSALKKSPKNPAYIYELLSQVADRQGLRDEAEADMLKAVALQPNIPGYHSALGSLYLERRNVGDRLNKAIDEYKLLIKLDPYEVEGYQKLGIAYAAKGDLHRAARNLEHAIDLLPGDGATFEELGRVYARMGNKAESDRMFELYHKYIAYDLQQKTLTTQSREHKRDPKAQQALGEFLEKSGNYTDAMQYYRLALSLEPGNAELRAKIQHLDSLLGQSSGESPR